MGWVIGNYNYLTIFDQQNYVSYIQSYNINRNTVGKTNTTDLLISGFWSQSFNKNNIKNFGKHNFQHPHVSNNLISILCFTVLRAAFFIHSINVCWVLQWQNSKQDSLCSGQTFNVAHCNLLRLNLQQRLHDV